MTFQERMIPLLVFLVTVGCVDFGQSVNGEANSVNEVTQ